MPKTINTLNFFLTTNLSSKKFVLSTKKGDIMKNKTLKVIIILVGILVINIEAAHAGITHKFKVFINNEFTDFQLLYVSFGLFSLSFMGYVIFMPAFKEKSNFVNSLGYFKKHNLYTYQKRRLGVKKISEILNNAKNAQTTS